MSVLEKLTEGIVNRNMEKEGQALLSKWSQTGLLEGLQSEHEQHNMARLLENQAKELLREASTMEGGNVQGFAAVAFPIVRRVFAGLIANDLVSVQPMSLPSGLIFFLDFTFESSRSGADAAASLYGGQRVGSGISEGLLLNNAGVDTQPFAFLAPYGSATASIPAAKAFTAVTKGLDGVDFLSSTIVTGSNTIETILASSDASAVTILCEGDPDLLADTNKFLKVVSVVQSDIEQTDGDLSERMYSSILLPITGNVPADADTAAQIKRLTQVDPNTAGNLLFFYISDTTLAAAAAATQAGSYVQLDQIDNVGTSNQGAVVGAQLWPLENESAIPEINIKVDSLAIVAATKKLKAKWTPELGQDLQAYHNLDAEVELTSILSEQIALEIDREILQDLVRGATAGTYYWSRSPGFFVDRLTGAQIGVNTGVPDFTGTVSEWYETLIETMNDVSAQIHRKTLRGGANFVVCGPEVANILEFTSGFRANVTADADKGDIGAVKAGSLNRKWDVIVDPYFPRSVVLVGRRGNSFLESGYVYAPYVPLQTTPTIFGPEDFVPRKGVMTRYAKKMVRPDMYGLVIVRGLLGEGD
jgi:hypothetical protein